MGFLGDVVATREPDEEIHVILDNLSAHKTKLVDLDGLRTEASSGIDVFTPTHDQQTCPSCRRQASRAQIKRYHRPMKNACSSKNTESPETLWDGSTQGDSYPQEFQETQYFSSCTTFFIDR